MRILSLIISILLIAGLPSMGIYAICGYFFDLNPVIINVITGVFMFIFGGTLIAYSNKKKGEEDDRN